MREMCEKTSHQHRLIGCRGGRKDDSEAPIPADAVERCSKIQQENHKKWCRTSLFILAVTTTVFCFVARGLWRAPEISVCSFIREQLGLGCEEHLATTQDGYQLFLKRIPGSEKSSRPVLLLPGLADSAATWVVTGRDNCLAGELHRKGFDVWLLEKRGRTPWKHERYSGQDLEFWDFSFDDSVDHDLPAVVAYVTKFTGLPIASLVGHSEGGTISLAALAENHKMQSSVKSVVAPPEHGIIE